METTKYSDKIEGEPRNYKWPVQFDKTGGFVGITQTRDGDKLERVLLSKKQYQALVKFVGK